MATLSAVATLQRVECHFKENELDRFSDEVHDICSMDQFWRIGDVSDGIRRLELELNRLEIIKKKLILRIQRLEGNRRDTLINKIAQIALFIHLGDLTLLKFSSYLQDKVKQMKQDETLPPPRPSPRKAPSLSLPTS